MPTSKTLHANYPDYNCLFGMRLIFMLTFAITASLPTVIAGESKIIPGQAIGSVRLGEKLVNVEQGLGKSTDGDVSMGRLTETWEMKDGGILEVFCTRPDEHTFVVWKIRTTSKAFSISDGIRVGGSLEDIRKAYPSGSFGGKEARLELQDTKQGIIFEISGKQPTSSCTAISIYKPTY